VTNQRICAARVPKWPLWVESDRPTWPRSKHARAQDSAAVVAARMAKSVEEMSHWSEYAYVVVNRDLDASVAEVEAILTAERLRRTRQIGLADFVNHLRGG
jgi:guanylate kinase